MHESPNAAPGAAEQPSPQELAANMSIGDIRAELHERSMLARQNRESGEPTPPYAIPSEVLQAEVLRRKTQSEGSGNDFHQS
ncbi:MAG TPA: hypothetical protein VLF40_05270 [Candidatus Saccharimonadales bacterium]|nr:hypothetical protein [Candidatus Saccharimonadales bacterium]